jgi:hypothetical protein
MQKIWNLFHFDKVHLKKPCAVLVRVTIILTVHEKTRQVIKKKYYSTKIGTFECVRIR